MSQKGQTGVLILIGILIIALVAGGAYYFGRQTGPKLQTTPTPNASPANASPVPNGTGETANQKTYTTTKYGYLFKYPTNWKVTENSSGPVQLSITSPDFSTSPGGEAGDITESGVSVIIFQYPNDSNVNNLTVDKLLTQQYSPKELASLAQYKSKISGLDAIVLVKKGYDFGDELIATFYKDGYAYNITMAVRKDSLTENDTKLFNQILFTFRFTQ